MKKLLIGAIAGAAITLVVYKLAKDGKLDDICDDIDDFAGKAKRKIKDETEEALDKAEYYKDRTSRKMKVAKRKIDRRIDDLKDTINDTLHGERLEEA